MRCPESERAREREGQRETGKQATKLNKPLMKAVTLMRRAVSLMKTVRLNKQQKR